MAQPANRLANQVAPPSNGDRLESWKEIASYLKRGVRTVQRWEREEALPVHRHLHSKLGSVYAYKAELDAWWHNGHSHLVAEPEVEAAPKRARLGPWRMAGMGLVAGALAAAVWWNWPAPSPPRARDWILLANIEKPAEANGLDGHLEQALAGAIVNSRSALAVSQTRIAETLQLMRRPLDSPIDAALAREICLRDGAIRAVMISRLKKLDGAYLLSVSLVDPQRDVEVASFSDSAQGNEGLLAMLQRVARALQKELPGNLAQIQQPTSKLARVTTNSLHALEDYSQGVDQLWQAHPAEAAELLERAVRWDPDFASAHVFLAKAYLKLRKPALAAPHFERAFQLANNLPSSEASFIYGTYYAEYEVDPQRAAQAFEMVLRNHPDDPWALDGLQWTYRHAEAYEKLVPHLARYADMHPADFIANVQAAQAFGVWNNDSVRAQPYFERARAQLSQARTTSSPYFVLWIELMPVHQLWLADKPQEALQELDRLAVSVRPPPGFNDGPTVETVAAAYLTLGKLKKAEELYASLRLDDPRRSAGLLLLAEIRGDENALRDHLTRNFRLWPSHWSRAQMARAGFLAEVNKDLDRLSPSMRQLVRGEIHLARGEAPAAIASLEDAIPRLRPWAGALFLLASGDLARVYESRGNLSKAIQTLEVAAGEKQRMALHGAWAPLYWLQNEASLARLYRNSGSLEDATIVEERLRRLLSVADADHPILVGLQTQDGKIAKGKD